VISANTLDSSNSWTLKYSLLVVELFNHELHGLVAFTVEVDEYKCFRTLTVVVGK
jgi:hypothetical protein